MSKFKTGDRVVHATHSYGTGTVVEKDNYTLVRWDNGITDEYGERFINPEPVGYYSNCSGGPRNGDVFCGHNSGNYILVDGHYYYALASGNRYSLIEGGWEHSLDRQQHEPRRLLVRDGQRWPGR